MGERRKVAIIGCGPAGIAAALQLKRFDINFFLFEKNRVGGLLRNGNLIENYPGFHKGVPGHVLAAHLEEHLSSFEIFPFREEIKKIDFSNRGGYFLLEGENRKYLSDFVIAATGTKPKIPDILKNIKDEILSYVYFDIVQFMNLKDKRVLVIGGGDCAFDYSLSLSVNNNVVLANRSNKIRAIPLLKRKVFKTKSIEYRENCSIISIEKGKHNPLSILFSGERTSEKGNFDLLVFAVGRLPEDEYLSGLSHKSRMEAENTGKLVFSGDIKNGNFRQAVIAAGNGVEAAMKIRRKIVGE